MRHLKAGRKLNRTASHRRALFRNLAKALFDHESIKTTTPKAMELRRFADRLITMAKNNNLHSLRLAFAELRDKEIVRKLFTDIGLRYQGTDGGYTRVLKIGRRRGDAAPMAIIELTQKKEKETAEKEKKAPAKEKKAATKEKKAPKEKAPAKEKKAATKEKKAPKEKAPAKEKKVVNKEEKVEEA